MVLATHRYDTEGDRKAREALLRPVAHQNEAIRRHMRSRSPILDVDPETGEELENTADLELTASHAGEAVSED